MKLLKDDALLEKIFFFFVMMFQLNLVLQGTKELSCLCYVAQRIWTQSE